MHRRHIKAMLWPFMALPIWFVMSTITGDERRAPALPVVLFAVGFGVFFAWRYFKMHPDFADVRRGLGLRGRTLSRSIDPEAGARAADEILSDDPDA